MFLSGQSEDYRRLGRVPTLPVRALSTAGEIVTGRFVGLNDFPAGLAHSPLAG
jgi:hypothetical protein